MIFELIDESWGSLVDEFVRRGIFQKVEIPTYKGYLPKLPPAEISEEGWYNKVTDSQVDPASQIGGHIKYNLPEKTKTGVDLYLGNGFAIEGNFEDICRTAFGFAEDRKNWRKELSTAVKEYGHDDVLSGFYNWCETNNNFIGKKPISGFLRDVGSNLTVKKAVGFSNPNLDKMLKDIATVTEGKVLWYGSYRANLAGLINAWGSELVFKAFEQFYSNLSEKDNLSFAPKNFLEQADVLIPVLKKKLFEADQAKKRLEDAYRNAQATSYQEPEEDLEEL